MKKEKLGLKNWLLIWSLGMAGQLCWNIENQWFNTFVYEKISPNPSIITWMVAVSAIVTTIATFTLGTLSDRLGKRKPFISFGYILWGLFTIAFGLTQYANNLIVAVAVMVVAADAIMSFFGSVGNDAGFNAWTTDLLNDNNRGQIGAALAAHPILATIIGTVVGGIIIEVFGYFVFFIVMGVIVITMGMLAFFFLKESNSLSSKKTHDSYFKQLFSVFDFKSFVKNKELFTVFLTMSIFFIGFNVYFVHIGNYFIYNLGYSEGQAGIIQGLGLIIAIFATIPSAILINKGKSALLIKFALFIDIVGLMVLYFFADRSLVTLFIGIVLAGVGYVLVTQTLTVWAKKLYPVHNRGQFEGVRILFFVMIPMVIGPIIANPLIKHFGILKEINGREGMVPTSILFLAAAVIALMAYIPIIFAGRFEKLNAKTSSN